MGDVGDYWRDVRAYRRDVRSHWVECSSPGCQFGGNPVKVPPGEPCHHCGVVAAGEKGSANRKAAEPRRTAKNQWRDKLRTCGQCGKKLAHEQARRQHEIDKHGSAVPRQMPQLDDDYEVLF